VLRYTLAGHRILAHLVASVGRAIAPGAEMMCFRSNVDYSGSHTTWGCHESYLHRQAAEVLQPQLIPHLVTRLIYTGAGGFNPLGRGLEFTLSPRVAHLRQIISGSSTSDRGIWHTKSESLSGEYERLHILCGESLCSETAAFLKVGATALVVALADAGMAPGGALQLADPLGAMRRVAVDTACRAPLAMADGSNLTALAIQRRYLCQAEAHLGADFMPPWAAEVCKRWSAVLSQLEGAPGSVATTLDWGIKLALYADQACGMGIRWDALPFWNEIINQLQAALEQGEDGRKTVSLEVAIGPKSPIPGELARLVPLLESRGFHWQDLKTLLRSREKFFHMETRFGELGSKGIFQALDNAGVLNHRVKGVDNVEQAMTEPPAAGRARVRGRVIGRLAGAGDWDCDWERIVNFAEGKLLDLSDPFASEETWRSLTPAETRFSNVGASFMDFDGDFAMAAELDGTMRRQNALEYYLSGDYAGAEVVLRGLLEEHYQVPSTHCHLARALLMQDREGEAREQVSLAWVNREPAPAYMLPRILFFQCLLTMLDGADGNLVIGQIKAALRAPGASLDWTIQPVIDHLRTRLGETNYRFMKALAEALSDAAALVHLHDHPLWRDGAEPAPSPPVQATLPWSRPRRGRPRRGGSGDRQ
jgi:hypothetical protein